MTPQVSICLPSLNTRPFLGERMDSILSQTLQDWELIIVDDGSTDGSWEFFQQWQKKDSRIQLHRGPKQGLYPGWNDAIRRATGEYVYIATSDDTMAPDCLEKLCEALSDQADCGLAHCTLRTIDERGDETEFELYENWPFVKSSSDMLHCRHLRLAPFDGLLHLVGTSVYASMTQLLIRRNLFTKVGMFESRWGSLGDFNWNMRAALVSNTVHVPDTWAGWRLHDTQATAQRLDKDEFAQNVRDDGPRHRFIDAPFTETISTIRVEILEQVFQRTRRLVDASKRFKTPSRDVCHAQSLSRKPGRTRLRQMEVRFGQRLGIGAGRIDQEMVWNQPTVGPNRNPTAG